MAATSSAKADSESFFEVCDAFCKTGVTDSESLIEAMVSLLAKHHPGLDAEVALKAVFAREAESPTFIGPRVSMPHARLDGISKPLAAVATSEPGVLFAGSGERANVVVLVLTPRCAPAAYLKIASTVAAKLKEPGFMDDLLALDAPEELCRLFIGGARHIHGIVRASDVMTPPAVVLRETNSIKDAIDAIVRTGLAEIPVVDKEGDMVGVASARALLGVCIPDYLLWMEDLSRFSNFEPFETLLRKESSTWLADITDDEYASVSIDEPAIAVAEAMARHKTERCFVIDGAKLVGVVTLPSFLNNIFRD